MRKLPFLLLLFPFTAFNQNQLPVINNLSATLDSDNASISILYDLEDLDSDSIEISLEIAENGKPVYDINTSNATGDIGFPINPGTSKSISWSYGGLISNPGDYIIRLVADDHYEINIQDLVDQVDSNRLRSDLEFICGVRHRISGAAHLEEVKDSIESIFLEQGLNTSRQEFQFESYDAHNILGFKSGTSKSEKVYILDAHFDTVNDAPGADDNGSGVAGFMEALRVLSPYNFKKSIKFIGFDLEEEGLVGSNRYVNNGGIPNYEETEGVLNFEMIGYYDETPNSQTLPPGFEFLFPEAAMALEEDEFRGNFITNVATDAYLELHDAFNSASSTYVPDLKIISLVALAGFVPPDLLRSDHAFFWGANIPALMITDGANFRNIHYHTPDDEFSTLNFNFMTQVVQATVATLAELAEIEHSTISETTVNIPTKTIQLLDCDIKLIETNSEQIIIQSDNCNEYPDLIEIYNTNGQIIYRNTMDASIDLNLEVQSGQLAKGIYLIKLSKGNLIFTEKMFIH